MEVGISLNCKYAHEVIEKMREKDIYVSKLDEWEYRINPAWNHDLDNYEDDVVPGSSRERLRRAVRGTESDEKKGKKLKTPSKPARKAKAATEVKVQPTRSSRRKTSTANADDQIAVFVSEFSDVPTIGIKDIQGDSDVDSIANDEEIVITVDADDLKFDLSTDPFTLGKLPTSPPKSEPSASISVPLQESAPASAAIPEPPLTTSDPRPPPLKPLSTKTSSKIGDPEVSSTTSDTVQVPKPKSKHTREKSLPAQELKNKRSSDQTTASIPSKKSKMFSTMFEEALSAAHGIDKKTIKKKKSGQSVMQDIRRKSSIPLRALDTSEDGTGAASESKTTITPVSDSEEDAQVVPKTKKKEPQAPTQAALPIEQVVKTEIIKLEKKNVGMLVDFKASTVKPSSNLVSLKEQLRLARMRSMPVEPVATAGNSDSAGTDLKVADEDEAWEDDWGDTSTAPKATAVTPAKPTPKSVHKATPQVTAARGGKRTKPLAGQSGQNSVKKHQMRPLAMSGFKIPKKAPPKEVLPSENLEDTWGTPFQPELADFGPSSSNSVTSTATTSNAAASVDDWGAGDGGWG